MRTFEGRVGALVVFDRALPDGSMMLYELDRRSFLEAVAELVRTHGVSAHGGIDGVLFEMKPGPATQAGGNDDG